MHNQLAGLLWEDEAGYHFQYDEAFFASGKSPISLTMPLQQEAFHSEVLFPFFDGLIPEGWLLEIAQRNWKLNPRDRMGILLLTCYDCIGAVHVEPMDDEY